MAGVVIGVLPLVLLYPFVQRYLFEGLTFGGVKQ
jgi:ABC-type glycerol-3-phosphate transport system permease component